MEDYVHAERERDAKTNGGERERKKKKKRGKGTGGWSKKGGSKAAGEGDVSLGVVEQSACSAGDAGGEQSACGIGVGNGGEQSVCLMQPGGDVTSSKTDKALEVLEQMQQAGMKPDIVSYRSLITACANGGKTDEALEVFEKMQQAGMKPDIVSYNSLITACANGGKTDKALGMTCARSRLRDCHAA